MTPGRRPPRCARARARGRRPRRRAVAARGDRGRSGRRARHGARRRGTDARGIRPFSCWAPTTSSTRSAATPARSPRRRRTTCGCCAGLDEAPGREASAITIGEVRASTTRTGAGASGRAVGVRRARVGVAPGARARARARRKGLALQPDVGDRVVVAHDSRDPGRGVVLGGLRTTDGGEPGVGVVGRRRRRLRSAAADRAVRCG